MATTREPYRRYPPGPPAAQFGGPDTYQPDLYPDDDASAWQQEESADDYQPDLYPDDDAGAWQQEDHAGAWQQEDHASAWQQENHAGAWQREEGPADDYQPQQQPELRRASRNRVGERPASRDRVATRDRPASRNRAGERRASRNRVDEWMDKDFKFGGSRIKRKAVALILLGAPALLPLVFMAPALFTMNIPTFAGSVDDTLGTGAELCLFICLLITPLNTLTGQRWFVGLRRWYGIVMAICGLGDMIAAGLTDNFAGGFFGRVAGHGFELMGFFMVMLVIPLLATGNPWAQRKLGRYWKMLHRLIYVIWGLLFMHLILLEGTGFENGATHNGSGNPGDGDPIFHQRLYQYLACSLFLLTLRLPPIKRWIAARQQEGRNWLVWVTVAPIFALFIFGMIFAINEEIFKGFDSFVEHPSAE